ncbi:MAG: TetR/AcrR family transcriptional regulator [Burkholderiaceae bacterium]
MARKLGSDGAKTEEAIRVAAIDLIAERGFEAMTLRELAERVGVQPGTLYRYFPSKAGMLAALQVEHLDFLFERWTQEQPDTDDPLLRLRAFIDFHIRSHTLRRREVFVANMELRSLAPADYRRVVALRRRYEDILTRILDDGMHAGLFRLPDARIATFAVLAMLTGVGTWFNETGRVGKRELVDMYTQMVMQCVGTAPAAGTTRRSTSDRRSA